MALVLKQSWAVTYTGEQVQVSDATQDYIDGTDGGWGTTEGGSIDRADRALLFFSTFTSKDGTVSLLTMSDQLIGSNTKYSVALGAGLANTDKSLFKVTSTQDGNHYFYMIPLEQLAVAPGGPSENDAYYDTAAGAPYIYVDSTWVPVTDDNVQLLNDTTGGKLCKAMLDIRATIAMSVNSVDAFYEETKKNEKDLDMWIKEWDAEDRRLAAQLAFLNDAEATASDMLDSLKNRL